MKQSVKKQTTQVSASNVNTSASSRPRALSICAIMMCAGTGQRTGLGYNKILHYVGKKTVLELTLEKLLASWVQTVYLVINPADEPQILELIKNYKNVRFCYGGESRCDSVKAGLKEINMCDIVVIHDGARPNVSVDTINRSITSAIDYGSGVVAVPTTDSIKQISNNNIVKSLARSGLYNIQTPQTFRYSEIYHAYSTVTKQCTDCSEVYETAGYNPRIVMGDYQNIKITTLEDFYKANSTISKVGVGFDVHKLVAGRKLILGGVEIDYNKGLLGHSDADVLTHAIMDALLSAAGLPDIGKLFPDTDPAYKDVNSIHLLDIVNKSILRRDYTINNISAVIMAEKPKLEKIIPLMIGTLAKVLKINTDQVNISATTTEQLGMIGKGKGIASSACCLLFKSETKYIKRKTAKP